MESSSLATKEKEKSKSGPARSLEKLSGTDHEVHSNQENDQDNITDINQAALIILPTNL